MIALRPYQIDVVDRVRASFVRSRCIAYPKRRAAHDPPRLPLARTALRLAPRAAVAKPRARLLRPDGLRPEQAVETLNDCDCLQLIAPKEAQGDEQQG